MKTFPLTLAAIKTAENHQWAIGDALLAECGAPSRNGVTDGSRVLLQEAAKYLLSQGYDYDTTTLAQFRETAFAFRKAERLPDIAFHTHRAAGTPEYLKAVIAGAPKGTKITQGFIEDIRNTQREEAQRAREAANRKAQLAREKAEAEEADARRRKDEEASKKAAARAKQARENEEATKVAPKRPTITPPKPEEVPELVAKTQFLAHASRSAALAKQATEDLKHCLDQLSDRAVAGLTDAALEAANAWTEAARIIRKEVKNQHGHLSVVG